MWAPPSSHCLSLKTRWETLSERVITRRSGTKHLTDVAFKRTPHRYLSPQRQTFHRFHLLTVGFCLVQYPRPNSTSKHCMAAYSSCCVKRVQLSVICRNIVAAYLKRDRCPLGCQERLDTDWTKWRWTSLWQRMRWVTQRDECSYCPFILSAPPTGSPHSSPTD